MRQPRCKDRFRGCAAGLPAGEAIQVETSSGDVHIRNLADVSFRLESETGSGDLEGAVFRELGADEDAKRFQGVYGGLPGISNPSCGPEAGICGWSDRCSAGNLCIRTLMDG